MTSEIEFPREMSEEDALFWNMERSSVYKPKSQDWPLA